MLDELRTAEGGGGGGSVVQGERHRSVSNTAKKKAKIIAGPKETPRLSTRIGDVCY